MAEPPLNLPCEQQNLETDIHGFAGLKVSYTSRQIFTGFSAYTQPLLGASHVCGIGPHGILSILLKQEPVTSLICYLPWQRGSCLRSKLGQ